jgi:hypothetical protein
MRTLKTFENFPGSGLPDDYQSKTGDMSGEHKHRHTHSEESKVSTRGNNFRIDISDFEKLSREVGYYNAKSNIKDEDDNYDEEAISKYEKLREEQLDMLEELIKFYSK